MHPRDRVANLGVLGMAGLSWAVTLIFLTARSPRGDPGAQLLGAALLGVSFGLTSGPLFWLASFARRRRIAYRGDWLKAARRGAWVGLVVAFFVLLRAQEAFSLPIVLFVVAMVAFVELTLSFSR
jgi:hypothetical protein